MMKRDLVTARPGDQLFNVVSLMYKAGVGSVVVVDEANRPIGIFTERDLVRAVAEGIPMNMPISHIMTKNVIVAKTEESLTTAAHKMLDHGIRHLPVVDEDGRLVGIISIRDVVKALITDSQFP